MAFHRSGRLMSGRKADRLLSVAGWNWLLETGGGARMGFKFSSDGRTV
jgi:hypothetical protein